MNIVKRWTSSVASSFDWVITQVENHDVLVSAAIREMQSAGAKARVQLERVKRDGEKMNSRICELAELETLWNERAVRVHQEDKEKALECLRRKHQAKREHANLQIQLQEHSRVQEQLVKDLKMIDERVNELRRKKNCLSARQYRAEAMKAGQLSDLGLIGEIDDIFDRWEMKLGQYEVAINSTDNFEDNFQREEDDSNLEAELATLVGKSV